jgi:hypothetical protein
MPGGTDSVGRCRRILALFLARADLSGAAGPRCFGDTGEFVVGGPAQRKQAREGVLLQFDAGLRTDRVVRPFLASSECSAIRETTVEG